MFSKGLRTEGSIRVHQGQPEQVHVPKLEVGVAWCCERYVSETMLHVTANFGYNSSPSHIWVLKIGNSICVHLGQYRSTGLISKLFRNWRADGQVAQRSEQRA